MPDVARLLAELDALLPGDPLPEQLRDELAVLLRQEVERRRRPPLVAPDPAMRPRSPW